MTSSPPYRVIFLCGENACRSIMAEALLNHMGQGRFVAYSAGVEPKGSVHPMAIEVLTGLGVSTEGLHSKHWSHFQGNDAPAFDFVFTLCDDLSGEKCPMVSGQPLRAHWGLEDPSKFEGSEDIRTMKFKETAVILESCVRMLTEISLEGLSKVSLKETVQGIEGIIGDARKHPSPALH